jgi:hypothetical protein
MIDTEMSILQEEETKLIAQVKETRGIVQSRYANMTRARECADVALKELNVNISSPESNCSISITKEQRVEAEDQYHSWLGSTP